LLLDGFIKLEINIPLLISKILLFLKNNFIKKEKSPSANAKGLEIVSSPYWIGLELFV
jgi:hypothetical protein